MLGTSSQGPSRTVPTPVKSISDTKHWLRTAETISEALPYMRRFAGRTFVIKYGGHAMGDDALSRNFARDVVLLKQVGINPVVVHGGGPQIAHMLSRLNIKSDFVDGLRVTDDATVEVVEMVLAGTINKQIVTMINGVGGTAVGLSGKDGRLIEATRLSRKTRDPDSNIERVIDLGFVGEPQRINVDVLTHFAESDIIPVIAPIGVGPEGETYNINADTAAGAIAAALSAAKLLMLTDVPGVLDESGTLISRMTASEARTLLAGSGVSGGMIPKIETCLAAIERSTEAAHILDGRVPHVLLLEVFTEHGTGTMIVADKPHA
jgi:acetylglutamate kinase